MKLRVTFVEYFFLLVISLLQLSCNSKPDYAKEEKLVAEHLSKKLGISAKSFWFQVYPNNQFNLPGLVGLNAYWQPGDHEGEHCFVYEGEKTPQILCEDNPEALFKVLIKEYGLGDNHGPSRLAMWQWLKLLSFGLHVELVDYFLGDSHSQTLSWIPKEVLKQVKPPAFLHTLGMVNNDKTQISFYYLSKESAPNRGFNALKQMTISIDGSGGVWGIKVDTKELYPNKP